MRDYLNKDLKDNEEIFFKIESNNENILTINQRYDIRIISLEDNNLIIPINTIRNEFCKINENNKNCTFLFTQQECYKQEKIIFLVPNNDKANITVYDEEYKEISNGTNYIELNITIHQKKNIK